MATQAMNVDVIPVAELNSPPNEVSNNNNTPMIVSDDDGEEVAGEILDESALDDCSSVVESDSEWGAVFGDHDGGVVKEGALSASNLEAWLFSSSSPSEDVVSEDDVDMENNSENEDNMEFVKKQESADTDDIAPVTSADDDEAEPTPDDEIPENTDGIADANIAPVTSSDNPTPDDETPINRKETTEATSKQSNQSVEDALSRIKTIDAEKVKKQQQTQSPSDKDFFEPVVPDLAVAERKMQETRTSKELELEAIRNRGLAGRNSRQLKKTINKNLQIQIDDAQRNGNMEWRKIGSADDSQDEIEIGTMTTGTATTPQLQQATSPASVSSPSMAYEQMAMEQQKERDRAKKMEQETMIQNQLHPESQRKTEQKLLEMDFVFGLLVGQNDPPPEVRAATKAAAKIVPNMLTSKKTIYYDPRYPPKVDVIELDEAYDAKAAAQKAAEALGDKAAKGKLLLQKRYMVRGKVPVLPRKRSKKSNSSSSDPKSPTTNATISTQPLTPLTAAGSASNSVCSTEPAIKEALALPSMEEVTSPTSAAAAADTPNDVNVKEDAAVLEPALSEEVEIGGVLEGPANTSIEDILEQSEHNESSSAEVASSKKKSQPKPNLVVDTRSSSTNIKSIRMSKDAELEAIRQRGVAKQKNLGFTQLEAQSASIKAAYEAEQQDLQKRKSGASEFQFSAGRIVNPLDQLYLQQSKQNRSYRQIQQQTLEEYHRISPSAGEGVNDNKKEEKGDTPSDEEDTAAKPSNNENSTSPTNPEPREPPSLQAKDQASRQSRYDKFFQKIRPKSKKSIVQEDEIDPIWQQDASKEKSAEPEMTKEERQSRYDALFQKEKSTEPSMDVKSSEIKFEQLRAAKQEELKALRERGLQHKTSDGKIRLASENVQVSQVQENATTTTTTPPSGNTDGLVGFGMFVKKSPTSRPAGDNLDLNPGGVAKPNPAGQAWRASDDASPSRLKHSSLKNKEAEELARLRQQGLAKRGSQQYSVFEKNSREAQLEYEKAAQDLARRKSQTSEYIYNGTKEINPVDAVYLDHQKWRKDTMKEDKEALGLFDEAPAHVDQEDVEGQIPVSDAKFTNTNGYQKWESGDRAIGDKKKKKKKFGVASNCGCTIM